MIISKKMLNFASETEHKTMDKIIEITNNQSRHAEGIYDNHHKESLEVDYSDDDIVILDNMRDIVAAEPMRFMMNGVFVCFNGTIQVDVNGQQHTYHKNQLVMFPPNTTLDNYLFSVDFECKALLMTNHIIQRFMRPYIDVWNHVVYVKKILERQLTDIDMEFTRKVYDVIRFCLDYGSDNYKKEMVHSFIQGALMGLGGMILREEDYEGMAQEKAQSSNLFPRFLDLLQKSKVKHRPVADYASQLFVSPKYLSLVCKQHSGKTALQWIEEYTVLTSTIIFAPRNTPLRRLPTSSASPTLRSSASMSDNNSAAHRWNTAIRKRNRPEDKSRPLFCVMIIFCYLCKGNNSNEKVDRFLFKGIASKRRRQLATGRTDSRCHRVLPSLLPQTLWPWTV